MDEASKKRLQPSQLNDKFYGAELSFLDYIEQMRAIILKTRPDLTKFSSDTVLNANAPFERVPSSTQFENPQTGRIHNGILLIHGLFDSPSTLQSMSDYFFSQGFLVRAVLLPGHGTVPGDLLHVDYKEWIKATQYGINSFKGQVDNLYILGFSMGGTLALYQCLQGANIKGLFLFSPAMQIRDSNWFLFNKYTQLVTLAGQIYKPFQWYYLNSDSDYAKYESFCFNPAYQAFLLTQETIKLAKTKKITQPFFLALSGDDELVDSQIALDFFTSQPNGLSKIIFYANQPAPSEDPRITVVPSKMLEHKILNFSHICVPISPSHPHYGEYADYKTFRPQFKIGSKTFKNNIGKEVYYGAVSTTNLRDYTLYRLTYNPKFSELSSYLGDFLLRLGAFLQ